jgi:DHA1 family multidrug resistance protein-like MFS transporter/DHA1 family quinolone resistance protein-like MFS transporter
LLTGSLLFLSASFLLTGASIALPKIRQDITVNFNKNGVSDGLNNSTPLRFPAWVGIFTTYTVIGVIVNIFPVFALEKTSLDKTAIGLLLQARALFAAIGFIYMGRTTFWHFLPSQMLIGQGGLAVCVFLMIFTTSALPIAIVFSCMGIGMAFSYFNSLFHGVSGSINRSGRMAVHESLISSGLIVGSVVGGVLYQKFSMILVYNFCTAFILLGILLQGLLIWLSARKKSESKGS